MNKAAFGLLVSFAFIILGIYLATDHEKYHDGNLGWQNYIGIAIILFFTINAFIALKKIFFNKK